MLTQEEESNGILKLSVEYKDLYMFVEWVVVWELEVYFLHII